MGWIGDAKMSLRRSGYLAEPELTLEERWGGDCAHCGRPKNDHISSEWSDVDDVLPRHLCGQCEAVNTLRRHRRVLAWLLVVVTFGAIYFSLEPGTGPVEPGPDRCYSMSGEVPC